MSATVVNIASARKPTLSRFIASRCHPDHNQDSEVSTRAMAWLNAVPREARP